MYLLDGAVVLMLREARRAGGGHPGGTWAQRVPVQQMFLSAATLLEFEEAAASALSRAKESGAAWRDWIDRQLVPAFAERILPIDAAVVQRHGQLGYADWRDGLLAATALTHHLALVTAEPRRFRSGRVRVLTPPELETGAAEEADWRDATRSGGNWLRNLLIR